MDALALLTISSWRDLVMSESLNSTDCGLMGPPVSHQRDQVLFVIPIWD